MSDDNNDKEDVRKINRAVVTVSAVARIIRAISDCYRNALTRELALYLEFVGQLLDKGRALLPRLEQHQLLVDKLKRDVYTPSLLHHFTTR